MGLISLPEHYFELIHCVIFWIFKQNIQSSTGTLSALFIYCFYFA